MPDTSTPRTRTPHSLRSVAAITMLLALIAAGCAAASFDPTGPCKADGATPGAYPELEAAVPKAFRGGPPLQLDSGRTCTAEGLSTLASHGVTELRFAGGTWETGTDSGLSLAVFVDASGPPLTPEWLAEFYETGARAGKNVQDVKTSDYLSGDLATAQRIDVLNGESYQTLVIWARDGRVAVALVGSFIREIQTRDAHDRVVDEAVNAWIGDGGQAETPPPVPVDEPSSLSGG